MKLSSSANRPGDMECAALNRNAKGGGQVREGPPCGGPSVLSGNINSPGIFGEQLSTKNWTNNGGHLTRA
jgi:hypothetical protein